MCVKQSFIVSFTNAQKKHVTDTMGMCGEAFIDETLSIDCMLLVEQLQPLECISCLNQRAL